MPIFEGIIDPAGRIVRRRGAFQVVSKQNNHLELDFGDDVAASFVLATAWRGDGDIGIANAAVSASPDLGNRRRYHFAVADSYGVSFRLDSDAAEGEDVVSSGGGVAVQAGPPTREWYAWNNLMPPKPDYFHIVGEVQVGNPGIDPYLTYREPQGLNPKVILLDLHLRQQPGIWPQVLTWKPVHFRRRLTGEPYSLAEVFVDGDSIAQVEVEDVH